MSARSIVALAFAFVVLGGGCAQPPTFVAASADPRVFFTMGPVSPQCRAIAPISGKPVVGLRDPYVGEALLNAKRDLRDQALRLGANVVRFEVLQRPAPTPLVDVIAGAPMFKEPLMHGVAYSCVASPSSPPPEPASIAL